MLQIGLIALFVIWGVFNVWQLRHVSREIVNSTSLGWAIFVFVIIAFIFGPLSFVLGTEPQILILTQGFAIIVATHVFVLSYIGNILLIIY